MKQLAFLAAVILCMTWVCAGEANMDKTSREFRDKFIKEFPKHGLSTTPGDAMFLRILIESSGAKRGVEVGSAFGFGAINMGIGFEKNGGKLFSLEIDPKMVKTSRESIEKVG